MIKRLAYVLWLLATLGLPAACARVGATQGADGRVPFRMDITDVDGTAIISWEGYTEGYRPGATATMRVAVWNHTSRPWNSRICVLLLEPRPSSGAVFLTEQSFTLESGAGFERQVTIDLPAGLRSGTHGLALVTHKPAGPFILIVPVHVGEGQREAFHGEWPQEAALQACPASADEKPIAERRISVRGVEVSRTSVVIRGESDLPAGACVSTELWADGTLQSWWPLDACASIEEGAWELVVPVPESEALRSGVRYMLRAFEKGGPNIVATFPFDLDPPPTPGL
ncbi:MAG: hypothetical protein K6V36_09795 [Anaerolineae bacterium]|nr:hypothetical protein [Anaerolineae bacterium]